MKKLYSRLFHAFLLIAFIAIFTAYPIAIGGSTLDALCLGIAAGVGTFCGLVGDKRKPDAGLFCGIISVSAVVFIVLGVENPYVRNGSVVFLAVWPSLMVVRFLCRSYRTVPEGAVAIDEEGRVYYQGEVYRENELVGDPSVTVYSKPFEIRLETDLACMDATVHKTTVALKATLQPHGRTLNLPVTLAVLSDEAEAAIKDLAAGKTLGEFLREAKAVSHMGRIENCEFKIFQLRFTAPFIHVT